MLVLVLVLAFTVLELLLGRASLVVFAVFFNTGMPSTTEVIKAIFNPENREFLVIYLAMGELFSTLFFHRRGVDFRNSGPRHRCRLGRHHQHPRGVFQPGRDAGHSSPRHCYPGAWG
jgi:hypothetical protein